MEHGRNRALDQDGVGVELLDCHEGGLLPWLSPPVLARLEQL